MIKVERPTPTWPPHLEALRDEVRKGTGILSEDDDLRSLLQECFDRGDALMGSVMWNEGWQECW